MHKKAAHKDGAPWSRCTVRCCAPLPAHLVAHLCGRMPGGAAVLIPSAGTMCSRGARIRGGTKRRRPCAAGCSRHTPKRRIVAAVSIGTVFSRSCGRLDPAPDYPAGGRDRRLPAGAKSGNGDPVELGSPARRGVSGFGGEFPWQGLALWQIFAPGGQNSLDPLPAQAPALLVLFWHQTTDGNSWSPHGPAFMLHPSAAPVAAAATAHDLRSLYLEVSSVSAFADVCRHAWRDKTWRVRRPNTCWQRIVFPGLLSPRPPRPNRGRPLGACAPRRGLPPPLTPPALPACRPSAIASLASTWPPPPSCHLSPPSLSRSPSIRTCGRRGPTGRCEAGFIPTGPACNACCCGGPCARLH